MLFYIPGKIRNNIIIHYVIIEVYERVNEPYIEILTPIVFDNERSNKIFIGRTEEQKMCPRKN